jgi:shikimate kinase / 3-dehydroquinate synthase
MNDVTEADLCTKRGIYLVGFSGTGKSTIARLIAEKQHWPVYDLDQIIVERSGMTIPLIFQREGEEGFRIRETEALHAVSAEGPFVIATGGGAVIRTENRQLMARRGWTVCLEGRAETLHIRIQHQLKKADPDAIRPMLDAVYPLDQVRSLKYSRQSLYALADWIVQTDRLTPGQVADEVIRAADLLEHSSVPFADSAPPGAPIRHSLNPDSPPPVVVAAGPWPYSVVVGWNHLSTLGEQLKRLLPLAHRAAVLTDDNAWARVGKKVQESLTSSGIESHIKSISPEERIKTAEEVSAVYDWLLSIRLRRHDVIVIIGGGAIDDLGGFAASTYMRGVPLIKVPTSLEGMVDGSIGGKTALNHPRARNLIGTFFHPRLVLSDVSLLLEESPVELRSGWAEVVKYGMLERSLLRDEEVQTLFFDELESRADQIKKLQKQTILNVVARCVALKAQVVAGDERDSGQYRILLNYGHTIAHALETITNYQLLHGEAVAIGMAVEARIAVRMGLARPEVEVRQNRLLQQFGLPTRLPRISQNELLDLIRRDKKVFGETPRWILPMEIGRARVVNSVKDDDILIALREISDLSMSGAPQS